MFLTSKRSRSQKKPICYKIIILLLALSASCYLCSLLWNNLLFQFFESGSPLEGSTSVEFLLHQFGRSTVTSRQFEGSATTGQTPDSTSGEGSEQLIKTLLAEASAVWQTSISKRKHAIDAFSHYFRKHPFRQYSHISIWDFFTPTFHCPRPIERIGRVGDGGKWVCGFTSKFIKATTPAESKQDSPPCLIYSFGISGEITFEKEILSRSKHCQIRMYDHTVSKFNISGATSVGRLVQKFPERATFYQVGLSSLKTRNETIRPLSELMNQNGDKFIDVLKIDIEGGEFDVMESIINEEFVGGEMLPFGQLQIEVHLGKFGETETFEKFKNWFEMLEGAGLKAFSAEPNQIPLLLKYHRYIVCYEYSFLNSKLNSSYFA